MPHALTWFAFVFASGQASGVPSALDRENCQYIPCKVFFSWIVAYSRPMSGYLMRGVAPSDSGFAGVAQPRCDSLDSNKNSARR